MADWDSDRIEQSHLREKLNDIAAEVSRLVYAVEGEAADSDETAARARAEILPTTRRSRHDAERRGTPEPVGQGSAVSDRMAALRDIQSRN